MRADNTDTGHVRYRGRQGAQAGAGVGEEIQFNVSTTEDTLGAEKRTKSSCTKKKSQKARRLAPSAGRMEVAGYENPPVILVESFASLPGSSSSSSSIHTPFCPIGMPDLLQFSYKGNRASRPGKNLCLPCVPSF